MLQRSLLNFSWHLCLVWIGYFGMIHSAFIWRELIIFNAVNQLLLVICDFGGVDLGFVSAPQWDSSKNSGSSEVKWKVWHWCQYIQDFHTVFYDCPSLIILKCHKAQPDLSKESSVLLEWSNMIFKSRRMIMFQLWGLPILFLYKERLEYTVLCMCCCTHSNFITCVNCSRLRQELG